MAMVAEGDKALILDDNLSITIGLKE